MKKALKRIFVEIYCRIFYWMGRIEGFIEARQNIRKWKKEGLTKDEMIKKAIDDGRILPENKKEAEEKYLEALKTLFVES